MKKPTLIAADGSKMMSPAQQECVQLLEQVLANAKNGQVEACVIVAVGASDFGIAIAGSDAPKLYLGCGTAMRTLEARTSGGPPRSVIHR